MSAPAGFSPGLLLGLVSLIREAAFTDTGGSLSVCSSACAFVVSTCGEQHVRSYKLCT